MNPGRVRTAPIDGNQQRIDEVEYFLTGIGHSLLGADGEDFRVLARFVPRSRNLSALLEQGKRTGADVAEDLRLLHSDLTAGRALAAESTDFRADLAVFRYGRYAALVEHPERLLERVEPRLRLEVASRITAGLASLAPALAAVNALAWLAAVGIPDLEREFRDPGAAPFSLPDEAPGIDEALDRVHARVARGPAPGLRAYLQAVYNELHGDYRTQLARIAARTQPLG